MWQDHSTQVHCGNPEDLAGENHRAGEAAGVPRPPGAGEDGGIHAAGNKLYVCIEMAIFYYFFPLYFHSCRYVHRRSTSDLYETEGPVHSGTFTCLYLRKSKVANIYPSPNLCHLVSEMVLNAKSKVKKQ